MNQVTNTLDSPSQQRRNAVPSVVSPSVRWIPEHSRSEQIIVLAILVLSFGYLCSFRRASWVDLDEGIILQGAQRILDGQVLYRDFFSFFTPGSYYLLALVFRVFGDSYLVAHTLLAVIGAAFSSITYLLARRVCGRQASLLVTSLVTATALPLRFVVLHNWDSTLWACLALYCAVRLLETSVTNWAFAAASFSSLTTLFEQSKGAGLLLGLGLGFLIIALYGRQPNVFDRRHMTAIALGLVWPLLITCVYFASHHALGDMLKSWFWPLQHYSTANRVPYGYGNMSETAQNELFHTGSILTQLVIRLVFTPRLWIPYVPVLGVVLLVRLSIPRCRGISLAGDWAYYVLISAVITGLLPTVIAVRGDYIHFFFLQPIFFLLLAWLLDGREIRSHFTRRIAPILGFCLCVSLLAMAAQEFVFHISSKNKVVTRRGVVAMATKDMVIEYVQAKVAAREKVLIYPYQSTYYFLTQTYSPTQFDFYQPGMHTDQQLRQMLDEFTHSRAKYVLYEPGFSDHIPEAWPNTPAAALATDPMADYIIRQYRRCAFVSSASNWQFEFMARRDLPCP